VEEEENEDEEVLAMAGQVVLTILFVALMAVVVLMVQ
jgi:hypothetical protein